RQEAGIVRARPALLRSLSTGSLALVLGMAPQVGAGERAGAAGAGGAAAKAGPARAADPGSAFLRAGEQLGQARGADKYTALRAVWRQWDQVDPQWVEEAIGQVMRAPDESPALRAYATLLAGYARRRRGDLEGARALIRSTGTVQHWLV